MNFLIFVIFLFFNSAFVNGMISDVGLDDESVECPSEELSPIELKQFYKVDSGQNTNQYVPLLTEDEVDIPCKVKSKKQISLKEQLKRIKAVEYETFKGLIVQKKLDQLKYARIYNELKLRNIEMTDLQNGIKRAVDFLSNVDLSKQETKFKKKINITKLYLSHNKLSNLPVELKELRLKLLDISSNNFTEFPPVIGKFTNTLQYLFAAYNKITEIKLGDKKASDFKKLLKIDLENNNIRTFHVASIIKRYNSSKGEFKIFLGNTKKTMRYYVKNCSVEPLAKIFEGNVEFIRED